MFYDGCDYRDHSRSKLFLLEQCLKYSKIWEALALTVPEGWCCPYESPGAAELVEASG